MKFLILGLALAWSGYSNSKLPKYPYWENQCANCWSIARFSKSNSCVRFMQQTADRKYYNGGMSLLIDILQMLSTRPFARAHLVFLVSKKCVEKNLCDYRELESLRKKLGKNSIQLSRKEIAEKVYELDSDADFCVRKVGKRYDLPKKFNSVFEFLRQNL